ncbi:MAG: GNAT family N-acetyltransferase [Desulfobacteraceae bacterium]|nr:MAG: GNAT family N-acetyltransferase [Desulfobacteraceae bacterium]
MKPLNQEAKFIDPISDPRWDRFVEGHHFGWICHLSGWKRVLESSFPHIKGYYPVLLDSSGESISAGVPVFQVKSWLTGNRLVSIPFATLCDPLISTPDDMRQLLELTKGLYLNNRNAYMEVRTLMSSDLMECRWFSKSLVFKNHYISLAPGLNEIRRKFHQKSVQNRIKKAINSGIELKTGESEADLFEFFKLHKLTRKRLGLPCHPYRFIRNMWYEFYPKGQISLFLALKDGHNVAGLISFKYKKRFSMELGAVNHKYMGISPTHFLYWNAITTAYKEGYHILDFGRTSSLNEGLMLFKKKWGTEVVDLPQFYYPHNKGRAQNEESIKYRIISKLCKIAPINLQETIGDFCYRHMG